MTPALTERRGNAMLSSPTAMGITSFKAFPSAIDSSISPATGQSQAADAVAAHCEVGMPYLWEAGEVLLTSVGFYAGAECHADTVQEEYLAGAAIESECTRVSMVRDIYMYSPD